MAADPNLFSNSHGHEFNLTDEEYKILKLLEAQSIEIQMRATDFIRSVIKTRLGLAPGGYYTQLFLEKKKVFIKPKKNTALPEKLMGMMET